MKVVPRLAATSGKVGPILGPVSPDHADGQVHQICIHLKFDPLAGSRRPLSTSLFSTSADSCVGFSVPVSLSAGILS
jgi:hypothetical protein